MRYEFATPEPPKLRVGIAAGRVEIETADALETVVEVEAIRGDIEGLRVEQNGREVVVEHRKRLSLGRRDEFEVRIRAPHGSAVETDTASADVRIHGRLAALNAKTASGDVESDHVDGEARVRSASGDVTVGSVGSRADVNTASGDIELGTVRGEIAVRSASGDVRVAEAATAVSILTASGDQEIGSAARGSVDLKSASGNVRVGIRRGSRVYVDARSMSGETSSEVELLDAETETEGPLVVLKAATMSGDIRVVRA